MFPYYTGSDQRVELDYDDIIAIQKLYGVGPQGTPALPDVSAATTVPTFDNAIDDEITSATDEPNTLPDPCHTDIDALSRIRNEIFAFKKQYFWRLDEQGYLVEKPLDIERFWYGFNINITHIDAVYERPKLDKTVFFIGQQFWEFTANVALPGYPKNLTELGLPETLEKIDAAFVWDFNDKTYFFSKDQYWRFDETLNYVEHDYPRNIKIWTGVPQDVDSAFTDSSGVTYFLKNNRVYRFNSYFMRVENGYPIKLSHLWNHCNMHMQNMPLIDTNSAAANLNLYLSYIKLPRFLLLPPLHLLICLILSFRTNPL